MPLWNLCLCLVVHFALLAIVDAEIPTEIVAQAVPIGQVREYSFSISWFDGAPAGFQRRLLGVNAQFPGPTIRGRFGDLVRVHVTNQIQTRDNTSIHWHGLHMRGTPWADGPEQVSQCPIVFGETHTYEFQLLETGTHWYHSHHGEQWADGLWGVIIVDAEREVWGHLYDEEVTITVIDHYLAIGETIKNWYLSPLNPDTDAPVPYSILINGQGYYPCEFAELQRVPCKQKPHAPSVVEVRAGVSYRIRVLSAASARGLHFSIDNHSLEAIEVDGVDTHLGGHVHEAFLSSAMRYSFIVNMTEGQVGSEFYIKADMRFPEEPPHDLNPYPEALLNPAVAILRYVEDPGRQPNKAHGHQPLTQQKPQAQVALNENLHCLPFGNRSAPNYYDEEIVITFDRETTDHGYPYFSTNGRRYEMVHGQPPNLLQVFWNQTLPPYSLPLATGGDGKVVQLVINNRHHRGHPIHLHGHSFWKAGLGGAGDGDYNATLHSGMLETDVVLRDTTRFNANSWLVLRYIADNPGVWLVHCHVNWHVSGGMAAVIIEGEDLLHQNFAVPGETLRVCRAAGITPPPPPHSGAVARKYGTGLLICLSVLLNLQ